MFVGALCQLPQTGDELIGGHGLSRIISVVTGAPMSLIPSKTIRCDDAGLCQDVAVEARQRTGTI